MYCLSTLFARARAADRSRLSVNGRRSALFFFLFVPCLLLAMLPFTYTTHAQSERAVQSTSDASIIGGETAEPGAYPWMVSIVNNGNEDIFWAQFCGGTLIHPQWVLTAAHCMDEDNRPFEVDEIDVLVGRETLRGTSGERIAVSQIIRHPSFNTINGNADIALLKLATASTGPILKIADSSMLDVDERGTFGTIIGWGRTQTKIRINNLQHAQVPLVGTETCAAAYRVLGYRLTPNMLCAGFRQGGVDACSGDSGGPLIVRADPANQSSQWIQAGIISWGKGCAEANAYGVYTHLARFRDWVDVQIVLNTEVADAGTSIFPPVGQRSQMSYIFMPMIGN